MNQPSAKESLRQFFDISDKIETYYEQYAKSFGLSYPGLLVLEVIYATPKNCTQKLICQQTLFPKQSVNSIIKTFWKLGYIEMKEIDTDRRNKAITLSQSGRRFADRVMGQLAEAEEASIGELTGEQRQAGIEFIRKLERAFRENLAAK